MPSKKKPSTNVSDIDLITTIIRSADDKKADNPIALDLTHIDGPASYFVICSGQSSPQLRAIVDAIVEATGVTHHVKPSAKDGSRESGWMILDYGSIMVHILSSDQRIHYSLEDLWHDATRMQIAI
jgi:ribosome-associated protein